MKKIFILLTLLMPLMVSAQTLINGIYYNLYSGTQQATVTSGSTKYSGKVTIPQTVTYNGVTYSVTEIKSAAFYYCQDLTEVTIPNSVMEIGKEAFSQCTALRFVNIPNSVTSIGESTFYKCWSLTSITIPNSVTTIGRLAFEYCTKLTSVTIPNSVTSIRNHAFYGCDKLTSVTIPNSVKTIEEATFAYTGLTSVIISNSVTTIGRIAFCGCKGLTEVTIPNSVTSIGEEAFYACDALKEVTIPNSATEIGKSAFKNCHSLKSLTIGNSVTSIGDYAFSSCENLTNFYCYADNPPSANSAFSYSPIGDATLYVAKTSVDAYNATAPWKEFGNIVAISIPTEINATNFPDANFRNWILSQDYGRDGVLTDEEIAAVTLIDVSGKSIQSLKGIEYFTALTSLYCYSNSLTSLDVSKNTALTLLSCSSNQFTSLDVSKNTALTALYCVKNKLTSLDVSKNTALTTLSCYGNQIKGTAMDALVSSLPTASSGIMNVIYNENEGNFMTTTQVAAVKAKGWTPQYYTGSEWQEYAGSEPVPVEKCATPTISFAGGKLQFSCETEGVEIVSKITCSDSGEYEGTDIPLTAAYTVTAYAKKSGYADSDVATKEINVGGTNAKKGDVNEDGTVNGTDIQEVINIIVHGDDEEKYLDPRVRFGFYETVAGYSVTVNSINVDYNLTIGTDAVGAVLNTTADYPTWDTANGQYSVVQPNEANTNTMLIKLDYTLTSEDGSGENIVVRNAEVVVPAEVLKWQHNKDYTYIL